MLLDFSDGQLAEDRVVHCYDSNFQVGALEFLSHNGLDGVDGHLHSLILGKIPSLLLELFLHVVHSILLFDTRTNSFISIVVARWVDLVQYGTLLFVNTSNDGLDTEYSLQCFLGVDLVVIGKP